MLEVVSTISFVQAINVLWLFTCINFEMSNDLNNIKNLYDYDQDDLL